MCETDAVEEDEGNFDTPPESPDDVQLDVSPCLQDELNELQSTEDYIKRNQEWIARSNGMYVGHIGGPLQCYII